MTTIQIDPRWRVQLEGEPEDIVELEQTLIQSVRSADDFVVWRIGDVPVLSTLRWDNLESHSDVLVKARAALGLLVGGINLLYGSRPLTVGTVYEFKPGVPFTMSRVTELTFLIKPSAEQRATPSDFKDILSLAESHEWLASSLVVLSGKQDWFNVFIIIEAIESFFGSEKAMRNSPLVDGSAIKKAKQMANSFRHLDNDKHQPSSPPVKLEDAWQLLKNSISSLTKTVVA